MNHNINEFTVTTAEGAYDIEAYVRYIGKDLLVAISGGEKPHIGAVAAATPRPSLKNPNAVSASASVLCMIGHKEDDLAKSASEKLASALNTHVVVTAGIHWDNLDEKGIQKIVQNTAMLIKMILNKLGK